MNPAEREQAILDLLPHAHTLALRHARTHGADYDDTIGDAYEATIRAVDSYNPDRHDDIAGWIAYKIPRALHDAHRTYAKSRSHGSGVAVYSLDQRQEWAVENMPGHQPGGASDLDAYDPALTYTEPGYDTVDDNDQLARIHQLARHLLTDRHWHMWQQYHAGRSLAQIGQDVGVTESRACQIVNDARWRVTRAYRERENQ